MRHQNSVSAHCSMGDIYTVPPADCYAQCGIPIPSNFTPASHIGTIVPSKKKQSKKRAVRRKDKDKPKRPLSAYNFFFKEERQRLLELLPAKEDVPDQKKQKRKKESHGKIGFENLAKEIGKRWQELSDDQSSSYKEKASEDMKRYKQEMDMFLAEAKGREAKTIEEMVKSALTIADTKMASDDNVDSQECVHDCDFEGEEHAQQKPTKKLKSNPLLITNVTEP